MSGLPIDPESQRPDVAEIGERLKSVVPNQSRPWCIKNLVPGYPMLAGWMGTWPQFLIVRWFAPLAARSQLYYQAELAHLEKQLIALENHSNSNPVPGQEGSSGSWKRLAGGGPAQRKQREVLAQIRKVLKEYHEEMIRIATIDRFEKPRSYDIRCLHGYLNSERMKSGTALSSRDKQLWGPLDVLKELPSDLMSSHAPPREDPFTNFFIRDVTRPVLQALGYLKSKSSEDGSHQTTFKHRRLQFVGRLITCIVAASLPIAPAALLSRSSKQELGVIMALNLLLAACLALFTAASRTEVFGVTATFGALQTAIVSNLDICKPSD